MIVDTFLNLIYALIYLITSPIRLLPDVAVNTGITGAITTAQQYISSFNTILPIDTIFAILGVFVGIESAYLLFKLIMWVVKRFPTQS